MATNPVGAPLQRPVQERENVVIRFAGDSGDGMQVTGMQFTTESVFAGNDIGTLPDFPAEIRAPTGTLYGVSAFQVNFSSKNVFTPGDDLDALVVMNPAALKTNLADLKQNGILILDKAEFTEPNLKKAEYAKNPLEDGSLDKYQTYQVEITKMTTLALKDMNLPNRSVMRSRNFFALGVVSWLFNRPIEPTLNWIKERFKRNPEVMEANTRALKAGYNLGENTEIFASTYEIKPAQIAPGVYRNITGNTATALGFIAAAQKAGLPIFLGSYPITPASDVLHDLSTLKNFNVYTFQAEDEIAGVGSALGAAFGGAIGITTTAGPGMNLKAETIGLAAAVELPLIITDIQRAGPSTGMPTKPEQADLLQALYGRHGEAPLPVIAASSPGDCFYAAFEAVRIAVKYMTPVILLTDGYLANASEPWPLPKAADLPDFKVQFRTDPQGFFPYLRDEDTLARPWVRPGTPGLEHRIGGLEKDYLTGNISYAPNNHEQMVRVRYRKMAKITQEIPPTKVDGPERGKLLVIGWGSTYGSIAAAVKEFQERGKAVSHAHLRYLNPLPPDLGEIISRFDKVLVPEMNMGQLLRVLRAEYLVDAVGLNKIQGRPFKVSEITARIARVLEE
ncbi:MAG TPA: 2-oxoacid:acceptor oxidoreductase subunit alpha [Candidatus Binatia bacterium]|nr:2-oxoacid:acceptor oxidoreductase subunit alpha [Candidatus Binatia bacterium]